MSRSYKHTPISVYTNKFLKKYANRVVRRQKMNLKVSKGGYKKVFDSWEIKDDCFWSDWKDYWKMEQKYFYYFKMKGFLVDKPDKKKCYREWWRYYKMK